MINSLLTKLQNLTIGNSEAEEAEKKNSDSDSDLDLDLDLDLDSDSEVEQKQKLPKVQPQSFDLDQARKIFDSQFSQAELLQTIASLEKSNKALQQQLGTVKQRIAALQKENQSVMQSSAITR
ncbi:MAG TPA: hypothetical protein PLD88_01305, partial [Candidatus Berkiella sp.]|nr:hypothetical protein [Candidatus Berkiella sp.]